jgi:hypothetical protein
MVIWRVMGWCLLIAAFVFTAGEAVVHGVLSEYGIVSSVRVLEVLAPEFLAALQTAVAANLHPLAWDPLLISLLQLPGWILLGGPGVILAWYFRNRTAATSELPEDYPHTTYEDIVAAAEEADYDDIGLPSKYRDLDDYDPTGRFVDGAPDYLAAGSRAEDLAATETPGKLDVMSVIRNLPRPGSGETGGGGKG